MLENWPAKFELFPAMFLPTFCCDLTEGIYLLTALRPIFEKIGEIYQVAAKPILAEITGSGQHFFSCWKCSMASWLLTVAPINSFMSFIKWCVRSFPISNFVERCAIDGRQRMLSVSGRVMGASKVFGSALQVTKVYHCSVYTFHRFQDFLIAKFPSHAVRLGYTPEYWNCCMRVIRRSVVNEISDYLHWWRTRCMAEGISTSGRCHGGLFQVPWRRRLWDR